MIFIDIENNPPSDDWIDKADELTAQLIAAGSIDERAAIIEANSVIWRNLKQHLQDISNGKCWYSEANDDFNYNHVDHFRPKSHAIDENNDDQGGYWWLAFNWRNYRLSGGVGNVRKRDYFAVRANKANDYTDALEDEEPYFLDPTEILDPPKLTFSIEGMVAPKNPDTESWDYKRAEYTIRRLNLNLETLKEGRREKYREAYNLIRDLSELLGLQEQNPSAARKQKISLKMKQLWKMARPEATYSATVKTCLSSSGYEWAFNLAT